MVFASRDTLATLRRTIGEYNFVAQYLQAPTPPWGVMIKPDWFRRYEPRDLPDRFDIIQQSWDTANQATELSDCSVCTIWGVSNKRTFLLEVLRKKMEYPELKRTVKELARLHTASTVLIEDKAPEAHILSGHPPSRSTA